MWADLVGITLVSWQIGVGHGLGPSIARISAAGALVLAFAKARLVGSEFMEIRHAPRAVRIIFGGWIVAVRPLSAGSV